MTITPVTVTPASNAGPFVNFRFADKSRRPRHLRLALVDGVGVALLLCGNDEIIAEQTDWNDETGSADIDRGDCSAAVKAADEAIFAAGCDSVSEELFSAFRGGEWKGLVTPIYFSKGEGVTAYGYDTWGRINETEVPSSVRKWADDLAETAKDELRASIYLSIDRHRGTDAE